MISTDGKRTVAHYPASSLRSSATPDPAATTAEHYPDLMPAQGRLRADAANKLGCEAEAFLKGDAR